MAAALALWPAQAPAETVPVTGTVVAGGLSVRSPLGALAVPRLHAVKAGWRQAVVRVPVTVVDARGSGAGWALSMSASTRTASGGRAPGLRVSVWKMQVRCAGCTRPRVRSVLPQALPEQTPVRAFAAARQSGMGTMRVVARLLVTAPVTMPRGPYVLRATVSRVAGP
ncbi:MAG: hypothetical protein ACJ762_10445 [Solirubrobacteraceae bacterium]